MAAWAKCLKILWMSHFGRRFNEPIAPVLILGHVLGPIVYDVLNVAQTKRQEYHLHSHGPVWNKLRLRVSKSVFKNIDVKTQ
jgi:hypothetical protein